MMGKFVIDRLIINSPYEEPKLHWNYNRGTRLFDLEEGRRKAGYITASERSRSFDDPGDFHEIALVNQIRERVKKWRESGYIGVTGITKRLLEHWNDTEQRESHRFFFCQLEAIETLIWLNEAPESDKVGINIPSDGGDFMRLCCKMATGSGKTIVMSMLIAWQILNKVTYPQDTRYSKNVFVVAPGLTVKNRLGVLIPSSEGNYYDDFNIVPPGLGEKLRQGKVIVRNWQALNWESEERLAKKKTVDKRGPMSDEAYVREVLGDMSNANNIMVINDEAHHAWRIPPKIKAKDLGVDKDELDQATKWVGGLDRINKARGILRCYDFSATPFAPTGKKSTEQTLFGWITSDFGLNDAIESGLVKTPRVVIRDDVVPDAKSYKSKLYHIYEHVKEGLGKSEEHEPLPQLVQNAYLLLGIDWLNTAKKWRADITKTPPVMITVANRTETAARIKYMFDHKKLQAEELNELCDPDRILHIDSKVLEMAESQDEAFFPERGEADDGEGTARKMTRKEQAEDLRRKVDTIGQVGKPGEKIENVISVGMLSEGWDARTVTHIMGLRAFTSQLLCEQVVGRGLRRTTYDVDPETGLFEPEYVNIFGIPFTFLPHESHEDGQIPPPPPPKTWIAPDPIKKQYEISWPNLIRVDYTYKPLLSLDIDNVKPLVLNANETIKIAEVAPALNGKTFDSSAFTIYLKSLAVRYRTQKIIFEAARDAFEEIKPGWRGDKAYLLAQLIALIEKFIKSDKIRISPPFFNDDELGRRITITLNMNTIARYIIGLIRDSSMESIAPVFDSDKPIRSTGDMSGWWTGKPNHRTEKSHINNCVFDSAWEASEAFKLDHIDSVASWAKNDHLGFEIPYLYNGIVHKYRPDFLITLKNKKHLILEVKGQETEQDKAKRQALKEWVEAVNTHGGFGSWTLAVSKNPADIEGIIKNIT